MSENTREIVKKFNIRLTKSLGQNFLTDNSVVKRIVDAANIGKNDFIIEVGPGIGSMTKELAERAGSVVAVEIDKHLIPALEANLKEFSNVSIINNDILKLDFKRDIVENPAYGRQGSGTGPVKVAANLPYYITTPIIMKFLEEDPGIDTMVFMVQKEVAERMVAKPGGKDYGALSVAVQYYAKAEKAFNVPPHCFIPQPEVDSTVVKLSVYETPPVSLKDRNLFFRTVKAAFGQRRKTLVNALHNSGCFKENKEEIIKILESMGVGEKQRGETLTIMQFAELADALSVRNL